VTIEHNADLPDGAGKPLCRMLVREGLREKSLRGVVGPWQRRYREASGSA
jgi:hypothetical protein